MITNFKPLVLNLIKVDDMSDLSKTKIFEIPYEKLIKIFCENRRKKYGNCNCISCAISEILKDNSLGITKIITRIIQYNKIDINRLIDTEGLGKIIFLRGQLVE